MNKMKEIKDYEGYFVTETCDVWSSKRNRFLSKSYNNGYEKVIIKINGRHHNKMTHRLVAMAFIPNPENKPCVNHINGIKADNRIENLEWCTYSENNEHAFKLGLMMVTEKCKKSVREAIGIKVLNVNTGKIYETLSQVEKEYKISFYLLKRILGGYHKKGLPVFKYASDIIE